MFILSIFLTIVFSQTIAFSQITDSTISVMDRLQVEDFQGKISEKHRQKLQNITRCPSKKIRMMSLNVLFNLPSAEEKNPLPYHWESRKSRVAQYLLFSNADIIGMQELYIDQIEDLFQTEIAKKYAYYGLGRDDGKMQGEIQAIFYNKNRFSLVESKTIYFFHPTNKTNSNPYRNAFTYCQFKDICNGKKFIVINTHFSFYDIEYRYYEALSLQKFIQNLPKDLPLIVMGDFNIFPMRYDVDVPFHDGEYILQILTKNRLVNSKDIAALGHIGPIGTTNYSAALKQPFHVDGTPGVILDYIFVSENIQVWLHAIDPVKIDNLYLSDHLPVIADIYINSIKAR